MRGRFGRHVVMAVAAFAGGQAVAAPFGVRMGQSLAGLNAVPVKESRFFFKVTVPQPNAEFETYTVIATPQSGVCKIWGTGKDHADDRSGDNVREAFDRFRSILRDKYGKSDDFDDLKSGALWNKPNEWVQSINQNERDYVSYWILPASVDGLVSVSLEVKAYRPDVAYLDLTYEFANSSSARPSCRRRRPAALMSGERR